MKPREYDILVVGAGPAGSSAAAAAGQRGRRVLLIDRKPVVGRPVRCAEYIPAQLMGIVRPARGFTAQQVERMQTVLPDRTVIQTRTPGWIIHRDRFDQALAEEARKSGVEVGLSTTALKRDGDAVIIKKKGDPPVRIFPRIIIGADGPLSRVGRWMDSRNRNLIPAIQVSARLTRTRDFTAVYFDKTFFGGYGWVFPKGRFANVGIGMRPGPPGTRPLKDALDQFLVRLQDENVIQDEHKDLTVGWIPAEAPRTLVMGNTLLAGDAGGQTHPITGAGIAQAVICGRMAGKWAARALEKNDMGVLEGYEAEWRDLFGETLTRASDKRQALEQGWHRLEEILPECWVAFREYYIEN